MTDSAISMTARIAEAEEVLRQLWVKPGENPFDCWLEQLRSRVHTPTFIGVLISGPPVGSVVLLAKGEVLLKFLPHPFDIHEQAR